MISEHCEVRNGRFLTFFVPHVKDYLEVIRLFEEKGYNPGFGLQGFSK